MQGRRSGGPPHVHVSTWLKWWYLLSYNLHVSPPCTSTTSPLPITTTPYHAFHHHYSWTSPVSNLRLRRCLGGVHLRRCNYTCAGVQVVWLVLIKNMLHWLILILIWRYMYSESILNIWIWIFKWSAQLSPWSASGYGTILCTRWYSVSDATIVQPISKL
jgi:hypothetical protein